MDAPRDYTEFVENSPKIKYTMEMIRTIKEDPKTADRGAFIYIGDNGVNMTGYYVDYLVNELGYKRNQIGVIKGDVKVSEREDIKEKFNKGEIKVLIGGSPTKEGIDLQGNGYATFNIALGWNPTEMAQVEGRVWRQGNHASHVLMVYPLIENSGYAFIYQKFEEKAGRINSILSTDDNEVFDTGELDPKEKKLALITDPTQKANLAMLMDTEKVDSQLIYNKGVLEDIEKMKSEYSRNESEVKSYQSRIEISTDETRKAEYKKEIEKYKTKNKNIDKKVKDKEIGSFDKEIDRIKKEIVTLEAKKEGMKETLGGLIEKYTKEKEEVDKKAKKIDDLKQDISKNIENLYFKTKEQLEEEKQRKIEESEAQPRKKAQGSDAWIYDMVGRKYGVEPYAKQKVDIHEVYTEAIKLAPEGWEIRVEEPSKSNDLIREDGSEVIAYADLETKEIVISATEARKSTASHEVVHATISEMSQEARRVLLDTAKKQWEGVVGKKLSDDQAEEFIAEEFKYFSEDRKFKTESLFGRIKNFITTLWNRIKGVVGRDNKIRTLYEDILAGRIKIENTATGKRFQTMDEATRKMYDEIDAENWSPQKKAVEKELGWKYAKKEKQKTPSKIVESFKESSRRALVPIETVIGNINKDLKRRLGVFEYGVANSEVMQE